MRNGERVWFKVPKAVAIVDAPPKSPSGKLLMRELREQYAHLAGEIPAAQARR